ncbi:MAG: hypothetical protein ACYSUN_17330 [Planctomycetota bacterium]|jgi:hypothetical protein
MKFTTSYGEGRNQERGLAGPSGGDELIGTRILDHIVKGSGEYSSFKEQGLL